MKDVLGNDSEGPKSRELHKLPRSGEPPIITSSSIRKTLPLTRISVCSSLQTLITPSLRGHQDLSPRRSSCEPLSPIKASTSPSHRLQSSTSRVDDSSIQQQEFSARPYDPLYSRQGRVFLQPLPSASISRAQQGFDALVRNA